MHIRINIPPQRDSDKSYMYLSPLGTAKDSYIVPLEGIMLKDLDYTYKDSEYDREAKRSFTVEKTIRRYYKSKRFI